MATRANCCHAAKTTTLHTGPSMPLPPQSPPLSVPVVLPVAKGVGPILFANLISSRSYSSMFGS